jgi:hypothetical protein
MFGCAGEEAARPLVGAARNAEGQRVSGREAHDGTLREDDHSGPTEALRSADADSLSTGRRCRCELDDVPGAWPYVGEVVIDDGLGQQDFGGEGVGDALLFDPAGGFESEKPVLKFRIGPAERMCEFVERRETTPPEAGGLGDSNRLKFVVVAPVDVAAAIDLGPILDSDTKIRRDGKCRVESVGLEVAQPSR